MYIHTHYGNLNEVPQHQPSLCWKSVAWQVMHGLKVGLAQAYRTFYLRLTDSFHLCITFQASPRKKKTSHNYNLTHAESSTSGILAARLRRASSTFKCVDLLTTNPKTSTGSFAHTTVYCTVYLPWPVKALKHPY